jgi:metallo-beta-lactamase class B
MPKFETVGGHRPPLQGEHMKKFVLWLAINVFIAPQVIAQTAPVKTMEELIARVDSKNPLYINGNAEQEMHALPHHIMGNIYFVGSETLSSFLVTTPQGHILINSTWEKNVPLIRQSVEKLGFKFNDIKILLTSHGHNDHVHGDAMIKELTGAQVMIMAEDVPLVEKVMPGGKKHPIDRVLHHLQEVSLGGTTMVAHLTPAHTPGCTTWTTTAQEEGKNYNVLIQGCGIGTGRLVDENGNVLKETTDYIKTFKYMRTLPADVFLAAHGPQYNLMAKYANIGKNPNPFIDPQGYKNELDNWERFFHYQLIEQIKGITKPTFK